MARETKVGLIVGLGVILFVSVFVSDYLSVPTAGDEISADDLANFHDQTTNQPQFVLTRDEEVQPEPMDPGRFAAVILEQAERRHGPPVYVAPESTDIIEPPRRATGPGLTEVINDNPPVARQTYVPGDPIGRLAIDDPSHATARQLSTNRVGPGVDPLADVVRVEIPENPAIRPQPAQTEHTVASGENLSAIARKHYDGDGNMWRSIRDANPGKVGPNGEIVEGVVLTIPKRSTEAADPTAELTERATGSGDRPVRQRVRIITVKEGETLSEIAAEHLGSGAKWQQLMDVNADKLDKPEQLRAGMKLRIPAEDTIELVEEANGALNGSNNTPPRREQPAPPATNTYTVKSGDSLYRIAEKQLGDGDRFKQIYEANRDKLASPNDIKVGMVLKMPAR